MATKPWNITQLDGDGRTITLTSSYAPHGRPRKSTVVTDTTELRKSVTYYPGSNEPDIHIYGVRYEPLELQGRFEDRVLGPGGAIEMIRQLRRIQADGNQVQVSWGGFLSYRALLDRVEPQREAEHTIVYKLRFEVLADSDAEPQAEQPSVVTPKDLTAQMVAALLNYGVKLPANGIPGVRLSPEFLDSIDDLVSAINTPMAELLSLSDQVESFETAATADLRRLRATSANLSLAVANMRETVERTSDASDDIGAALAFDTSLATISWSVTRTQSDSDATAILALLAEFDRHAEIALRGRSLRAVDAREGDSWESLSVTAYGGPEGAQRLRDANGIRYGERPVPGIKYQVPTGS